MDGQAVGDGGLVGTGPRRLQQRFALDSYYLTAMKAAITVWLSVASCSDQASEDADLSNLGRRRRPPSQGSRENGDSRPALRITPVPVPRGQLP